VKKVFLFISVFAFVFSVLVMNVGGIANAATANTNAISNMLKAQQAAQKTTIGNIR